MKLDQRTFVVNQYCLYEQLFGKLFSRTHTLRAVCARKPNLPLIQACEWRELFNSVIIVRYFSAFTAQLVRNKLMILLCSICVQFQVIFLHKFTVSRYTDSEMLGLKRKHIFAGKTL